MEQMATIEPEKEQAADAALTAGKRPWQQTVEFAAEVPRYVMEAVEYAASLKGETLADFLINALCERTERIIDNQIENSGKNGTPQPDQAADVDVEPYMPRSLRNLSFRDRLMLGAALEDDDDDWEPGEYMKKVAEEYKKRVISL